MSIEHQVVLASIFDLHRGLNDGSGWIKPHLEGKPSAVIGLKD